MVLDGLTACHVPIIELGNAGGIGAYEVAGFTNAETDQTYLDIAEKTGASTATISRVNRSLNYGSDGYDMVFARLPGTSLH